MNATLCPSATVSNMRASDLQSVSGAQISHLSVYMIGVVIRLQVQRQSQSAISRAPEQAPRPSVFQGESAGAWHLHDFGLPARREEPKVSLTVGVFCMTAPDDRTQIMRHKARRSMETE
jgi:hypothetical protein